MLRASATGLSAAAFLVTAVVALGSHPALAEKRVALIVGNSTYSHVGSLPNTPRDAAAMAQLLKDAKFDSVELRQDIGVNDLRRAVRDFAATAQDADIAVVYYAGHGIEVDGVNYLIPVDAALKNDVDVEDETVSLDRILKVLEPVKRLRLVILDACRDNPFAKTMTRSVRTRSVGRGLAKVEPPSTDTLVAFAARAGSTASDGDSSNSPFTAALVKNIAEPGLDLRIAFGKVRDDVLRSTSNRQEPFVYGSLGGSTIALVPKDDALEAARPATPAPAPADATAAMRLDYELAAKVATLKGWDSFLAAYTSGFYADLARAQRAKLASLGDQKANPARSTQPAVRTETRPKSARSESEPGEGSLAYRQRVVVKSASCAEGQMLEIIGGSNSRGIARQRRCIKAD